MSDAANRLQITDSCRVIKSHASFLGACARRIMSMPSGYIPPCLDDLDETEATLRSALANIQDARNLLSTKRAA